MLYHLIPIRKTFFEVQIYSKRLNTKEKHERKQKELFMNEREKKTSYF